MQNSFYKQNIIDHYKSPRNKGVLESYDYKVNEVNTLCGDSLTFYIQLEKSKSTTKTNDENTDLNTHEDKIKESIIKKITFTGEGCAISQATASMLTEELIGEKLSELSKYLSKDYILELIGIDVNPGRIKCALLASKTLQRIPYEK